MLKAHELLVFASAGDLLDVQQMAGRDIIGRNVVSAGAATQRQRWVEHVVDAAHRAL